MISKKQEIPRPDISIKSLVTLYHGAGDVSAQDISRKRVR